MTDRAPRVGDGEEEDTLSGFAALKEESALKMLQLGVSCFDRRLMNFCQVLL